MHDAVTLEPAVPDQCALDSISVEDRPPSAGMTHGPYLPRGPAALEVALLMIVPAAVRAIDNGLGLTPPMGWRSWVRWQRGPADGLLLTA